MRQFDLETGNLVRDFQMLCRVTWLAIAPDGRRLIAGTGNEKAEAELEKGPRAGFGKLDKRSLANTIFVFDARNGRELDRLMGHPDSVNMTAVSLDGQLVVSGSSDRSVRVWSLAHV